MIGLLALVPALAALPADIAADLAAEQARHQGTWAVERSIRNGEEGPADVVREIVRVVEGDRVVWKRGGTSFAATKFELDPAAEPKAIDLIPEGGRNRGDRVLGIYKFEDDRLDICTADPGRTRPTSFEAGAGGGQTLMTFRRADPEGPGPAPAPDPAP